MGLPSGNRWAVSNIDATGPYFFQESPFQYQCSYFSWGNVSPHNPISETQFDYDFGGSNSSAPWYEGQPYGDTAGSMLTGNIPLSMDAARNLLGNPWRMPNNEAFIELFANVIFIDANGDEVDPAKADKRVRVNGVMGLYIQSKLNGARLFFSCSGNGSGLSLNSRESSGLYWSLTLYSARSARSLYFSGSAIIPQNFNFRNYGLPVRPIWNPSDLR